MKIKIKMAGIKEIAEIMIKTIINKVKLADIKKIKDTQKMILIMMIKSKAQKDVLKVVALQIIKKKMMIKAQNMEEKDKENMIQNQIVHNLLQKVDQNKRIRKKRKQIEKEV